MPIPNRRGPRALSEILGGLFAARGYGQFLARRELEDAWDAAVGEPACRRTRLGEVRRGVLNVAVSHPALLEELAAFRKAELLAALRTHAPGTTIHDIRFRVGPTGPDPEAGPGPEATAVDPGLAPPALEARGHERIEVKRAKGGERTAASRSREGYRSLRSPLSALRARSLRRPRGEAGA